MQFTEADLREFMEIWQEEFQESISMDEARHSAHLLLELYALLVEPLPGASLQVSESSLPHDRT
jgi:hypothetical protein